MRKSMKLLILLALAASLCFTACKKEEATAPQPAE